jgi:ribosomal protein RSM22 (predicted rRNA methylase)
MLPPELSRAIADLNAEIPRAELARAATELSVQYRERGRARLRLSAAHRAAYLSARLPATYAVISRVLREAKLRMPELQVESMLDLGAGPGTAMWAAKEQFSSLKHVVLVENSAEWIEIGRRLSSTSGNRAICSAQWQQQNLVADVPAGSYDLISLSYVINELGSDDQARVVLKAWERAKEFLVIIEPGTPEGFANVRRMRQELINSGAYIVAPCPDANQCPIGVGNWCHFSERLQRTSEHRTAKNAELGYEDEKYSYVIFSRQPIALPAARILRHPQRHSGHVEFELCTPGGLKRETISRKHGDRYKIAKKAGWGETL